jgi:hypothetical protein
MAYYLSTHYFLSLSLSLSPLTTNSPFRLGFSLFGPVKGLLSITMCKCAHTHTMTFKERGKQVSLYTKFDLPC